MARVRIPFVVRDTEGDAITDASVRVYTRGTISTVDTWDAETAGSIRSQPFAPDSNGAIIGWVEEGQPVDINLSGGSIVTPVTLPWEVVRAFPYLRVKEGANTRSGTVALTGGTATVSTTAVTAVSRIHLTVQSAGGTVGSPYVSARTAASNFHITSTSGTDTSTVAWLIVEPY